MNYQKHYDLLVSKARTRNLNGYKEKHHVIPICLGGDNGAFNLIELTAEEHYVAHQLLVKIYPDNRKLVFAANMMCVSSTTMAENRSPNKMHGWLKRRQNLALTGHGNAMYGKTGELSPRFGLPGHFAGKKRPEHSLKMKGVPKSQEHKDKIGDANRGKSKVKDNLCIHCNGMFDGANFKRWHGDNCKSYK